MAGEDTNFRFYLNRQGPAGPSGPKGPQGFSPTVETIDNGDGTWKLKVTTETGISYSDNIQGIIDWSDVKFTSSIGNDSIRIKDGVIRIYTGDTEVGAFSAHGVECNFLEASRIDAASYIKIRGKDVATLDDLNEEIKVREQRDTEIENSLHDETEQRVQNISELQTQINNLPTKQDMQNLKGDTASKLDTKQDTLIAGNNITIQDNVISSTGGGISDIPIASPTQLGGVKIGEGITVTPDGTISTAGGGITEVPQATEQELGGIRAVNVTDQEVNEVKIDPETGKLYSIGGGAPGVIDGGNATSIRAIESAGLSNTITNSILRAININETIKVEDN